MKTTTMVKAAVGASAACIVLAVVPPTMASAFGPTTVPCWGPGGGAAGLVAAINAANGSGGGTINLAWGCAYGLTSPDNGENGLPVVASQIVVNGNGATINGTGAVRIFEVDGPAGNLTLRDVTLTGGYAADFGGAIFNAGGTVTLTGSVVRGNTALMAGGRMSRVPWNFGGGPVMLRQLGAHLRIGV
jgi:hypothetical protein